jgi:ABC-type antimicrobial peptide transport system ATPase subunit
MTSLLPPKIILGMALAARDGPLYDNLNLHNEMLDVSAAYGVKDLDTSYIYVSHHVGLVGRLLL